MGYSVSKDSQLFKQRNRRLYLRAEYSVENTNPEVHASGHFKTRKTEILVNKGRGSE